MCRFDARRIRAQHDDRVAKLTDFDISRALWSEVTVTRTRGVCGKPPYLLPEVARGRAADRKPDIFSLGATLFAAVEGRTARPNPHGVSGTAHQVYMETPHHAGPLVA
ncbi:hypothetical protein [Streptomyces sp. NPDC005336]|uniref:protein kinase domain-containing protein n=1 Tax=Streptomyces sp. NPDC005336 TaxID=3157035 RepID=UPI0033A4971B